MKYSIRAVDVRDFEIAALLVRMQLECLPGDRPLPPDDGYWWVAYAEDGTPVGFCSLRASMRWQETGYLSRAGILEAHRGKGLQRRMIRVRINKARLLGWKWLITDTSQNPPSANSLIACGFKMYEPQDPYGLKTALYWRRKL